MNARGPLVFACAVAVLAGVACGGEGDEPEAAVAGSWEAAPRAPLSPREGALGAWTGTEALVIGDSDAPPCIDTGDCETPQVPALRDGAAFDPATRTWRRIATAPTAIFVAQAVTLGPRVYVWVPGDEFRPGLDPAFLSYESGADQWQRLPLPPTAGQPYRLTDAADEVLLYRDSDEQGESPDLRFDPRMQRWSELADDPLPPSYDRTLAWNGEVLAALAKPRRGGGPSAPPFLSGAAFDPASRSWRDLPRAPVIDMGMTGCWVDVNGKIINPSPGTDDEGNPDGGVLDPAAAQWSDLPEVPEDVPADGRYSGGIFTGEEFRCLSAEGLVFNAVGGEWIRIPDLPGADIENRTIVGTDRGAVAFGGFRRLDKAFEARLSDDTVVWDSGLGG